MRLLLAAIAEKRKLKQLFSDNLILVGDFNFYEDFDGETIQMIEDAGFFQIESLKGKDTNASKTEAYDRFFIRKNEYFQINKDGAGTEVAGVFDPFRFVYKDGKHNSYIAKMQEHYTGTKTPQELLDTIESYYKHPWAQEPGLRSLPDLVRSEYRQLETVPARKSRRALTRGRSIMPDPSTAKIKNFRLTAVAGHTRLSRLAISARARAPEEGDRPAGQHQGAEPGRRRLLHRVRTGRHDQSAPPARTSPGIRQCTDALRDG